jgi:thiol-disulfide isomerase/thioredoxin
MSKKARSSGTQKHRTQAAAGTNRLWFVAGGVGLVVVAAAVIAVALASSQPTISEPAEAPVVVTGATLPEYVEGTGDAAIGMTLPTIQGTDLEGVPMTIRADGRAKAIIILAHWCPHCQDEVPVIVDWLANNPVPEGVDVVSLSTGISEARANYPPSAWLEREDWAMPTLNDDANSTASVALGGMATPGWVFVAADGTVQLRTTGELPPEEFGAILEELAP